MAMSTLLVTTIALAIPPICGPCDLFVEAVDHYLCLESNRVIVALDVPSEFLQGTLGIELRHHDFLINR